MCNTSLHTAFSGSLWQHTYSFASQPEERMAMALISRNVYLPSFLQAKNLASTCFAYVCLNSFHPRLSLKIEPMKVHNTVRDIRMKNSEMPLSFKVLVIHSSCFGAEQKIERFMLHHNAKCHMAWYQDGLPSCHQYHWQWVQNWINQMAFWILQKAGIKECWKLKSPIPNLNTKRQIFFGSRYHTGS